MDCWLPATSMACQVLATSIACQVVPVAGANDDITGKWKLVKGRTLFYEPRTEDFSCNDIVYHFQADGKLTISRDIEDLMGFSAGQHTYEFEHQPLFVEYSELGYTLKIEKIKSLCGISGGSMIIDRSPFDGPILHLIRIQ